MAEDIVIVHTQGEVSILSADEELIKAKNDLVISENYKITTGIDGFIVLKIAGHSHFKIEEKTEIYIHQLPYFYADSTELEQGGIIELISGAILSEVNSTLGLESLKIVVSKTAMGVRGTRFLSAKQSDGSVVLSVDEGIVEIIGPEAKQVDYLEKGETIEISDKGRFFKRQKFQFTKLIDWNVKNEMRGQSFATLAAMAQKELLARRQVWTKDPNRIEKFKQNWNQEKLNRIKRIQKLKPSQRSLKRQQIKSKLEKNQFLKNKDTLVERMQQRQGTKKLKRTLKRRTKPADMLPQN